MNLNEECLIRFLNNPGRLEFTTRELRKVIFSLNDNTIINKQNLRKRFKLIDA